MFAVRAPASCANLGPGFDTLGVALDLYLEVVVESGNRGKEIMLIGQSGNADRTCPSDNLVYRAMLKVFQQVGGDFSGLRLTINSQIPAGKGLGSSAAAIVAGLFAANRWLGDKFSRDQLIAWAVEIEGHGDNVVPAAVGGLTTVMLHAGQVFYHRLVLPEEIRIVAAVPDIDMPTEKSRAILPDTVKLTTATANLQRACFFLASMYNRDFTHLDLAMDDMIFQQVRKNLVPGFDLALQAARTAGAIGVALSGAGPSIMAFCSGGEDAVGKALQQVFSREGIDSRIYILTPNLHGVEVLEKL